MATFIPLMKSNTTFLFCRNESLKVLERAASQSKGYRSCNVVYNQRHYHRKSILPPRVCNQNKLRKRILPEQQKRFLHVHPAVAEALRKKEPVVALESTIITHGMPHPENTKYVVVIL